MRKLIAPVAVLALAAVFVVPALAQDPNQPSTSVTFQGSVSPKKAGTKKHPQGVKLGFKVHWSTQAGFEPPIITAATAILPKGGVYNGGKYPKCSATTLNRKGLKGCPAHSIMGTAKSTAFADTTITHPKVTFVNGGKNKMCFFAQLTNPARVNLCAPATITRLGNGGYRVRITVPEALQVVAGVPIALTDFNGTIGGKAYARDYIATTSCPKSKKYEFSVETTYLYSDNHSETSPYKDSVPCS
jgi:hypothetical protein